MKFILFLLLAQVSLFAQVAKEVASCCEGEEGRCTGSAYCTACRNCSRCAHCGSGGSCGVCSSSESYYPPPAKTKTARKAKSTTSTQSLRSHYAGEVLLITTENVNLREGPGTNYDVVQTLGRNETVLFRKKFGDWALVEVQENGAEGCVHLKYLKR